MVTLPMTFCLGMVSMLFCHLDSDFPRPLIHQHPSTRLCLKIRSRHGTQISCLGSKHPPPDQPLISVPCLPVTQHCLLPLPPTFVSTPYFMTRREYPPIMVHRCLINADVLLSSHPSHGPAQHSKALLDHRHRSS